MFSFTASVVLKPSRLQTLLVVKLISMFVATELLPSILRDEELFAMWANPEPVENAILKGVADFQIEFVARESESSRHTLCANEPLVT